MPCLCYVSRHSSTPYPSRVTHLDLLEGHTRVAQLVKNLLAMHRPGFNLWVGKIPWRKETLPTPVICLENSMDCIVHEVAQSQTQLSDFHFSL